MHRSLTTRSAHAWPFGEPPGQVGEDDSAPARLIAVRCSRATASPSIHPFAAAALIMAYSPLTW